MHASNKTPRLTLDDLQVGDRFASGEHRLDTAQIKAFAQQFDPQPFHLDEAAAQDTMFGGLAASGWHTAAITMRLLVTGSMKIEGGLIGSNAELSWPSPTRADDVLHVDSEVIELQPSRSRPDRGAALIRNETRNQHGELRQVVVTRIVLPRRG
ncbi:MAG: hypothetical protein RLZZ618_485 [Pseudomonadota bacterium]